EGVFEGAAVFGCFRFLFARGYLGSHATHRAPHRLHPLSHRLALFRHGIPVSDLATTDGPSLCPSTPSCVRGFGFEWTPRCRVLVRSMFPTSAPVLRDFWPPRCCLRERNIVCRHVSRYRCRSYVSSSYQPPESPPTAKCH